MKKIEYTSLNLPKELVEKLKTLRLAHSTMTGRSISYAELLQKTIESYFGYFPELRQAVEEMEKKKGEEPRNCN